MFVENPGWHAINNGRTSGTFAWIDFSGTDVGVSLEVEDIDVSGLTNGQVFSLTTIKIGEQTEPH